jgi:virginiamycin B lyase
MKSAALYILGITYGLRVGDDGRVWGTELRGGRLFEHEPASGTTVVHPMPEPDGAPRRPAIDGDGHVWIPEYAANRLTRFDSDTREFRSFPFPMADVLPYVAEVDRRTGTVWIGTAAADVVFSFDAAVEEFRAYPMPTEGALIRHLVVEEARGEVWAAYGAFPGIPPRIVRIRPGSSGGDM